jgi:UDP-glucose 4-epimerase
MTTQEKIIVTGGAGFIGSHLAERLLAEGGHVIVLDNFSTGRRANLQAMDGHRELEIIPAELSSDSDWDRHFDGVSKVFHLAALADIVPSLQHPVNYFQSNVASTLRVLEAARRHRVHKFIYVASSSCYGLARQFPTPETAPIQPEYPYALTKNLGEQLVLHWAKVYKMSALSLRFFNVYGPRSRTTGAYGAVFGVFLAQKLAGKPLTVVGDGTQTRDFTFVTDVVEALVAAGKSALSGEIFNVGTGRPVAVNYLAELLGGSRISVPKRPGEPDCTQADISKIRRMLGWTPRVSFEAGVQEMLRHIDQWKDAPLWTPESIGQATQDWFHYLAANR